MSEYTGFFKARHELKGKAWIRQLPDDERSFLIHIGMMAFHFGQLGGKARAKTGKRDKKGRFTK